MMTTANIERFISEHVTGRAQSLLLDDFDRYSDELRTKINGKSVLVVGGAGTIGSFYIKALLKFKVKKLIVVDINENGLTELVRDLRSSLDYHIPEDFVTYPVNFGDPVFAKLFREHGSFDIVANFAAHKHVRSEKDIFSVEAMIENNVLRARKLLDLLLESPPEHFFCVSTDKAANPVNIMGASKKLMEELIMAYSDQIPIKTARFANVAFSNGSLPLGFLERLEKRQAWSCPLGIRRFFVSPKESGELCLMASIMGESGEIFFPKLDEGKMIPFDQIAHDLLAFLGMKADVCHTEEEAKLKAQELSLNPESRIPNPVLWPVYFFGSNTSGEKSFEEFYTEDEELDMDSFINLGVIKNSKKRPKEEIDEIFENLRLLFAQDKVTKADVVEVLRDYLPNFEHIEKERGLDEGM